MDLPLIILLPIWTNASTCFTLHFITQIKACTLCTPPDSLQHPRAHWLPPGDVSSCSPLSFTTLLLSKRFASLSTVLSRNGRCQPFPAMSWTFQY
uniref:Putative secreted protein n=1 Tax=Ixodes ricinus TaxID=34613 RepID=A0A6B0UCY2_IXORI